MSLTPQDAFLREFIAKACAPVSGRWQCSPGPVGVAVSGGSDSMALLHLMQDWAQNSGVILHAATVDHGLRPEAANEAKQVAKICAGLGVGHETLRWTDWDGKGNLQDQARQARYGLMAGWAGRLGISAIALGHTMDDQAETFLLRLARGSGVDGLSGMAAFHKKNGVNWLRPVLGLGRQQLREYLRGRDIGWVEDASNQDTRFDRVKARNILKLLTPLGIDTARLVSTAAALQSARSALDCQTQEAARNLVAVQGGDLVFAPDGFMALHPDIGARLLSQALRWVSSAKYPPRRAALQDLQMKIQAAKSSTLQGCRIVVKKSEIRITREYQAVKNLICPTDEIWDNRWQFSGPHDKLLQIRALGAAGLAQCPDWKNTGLARVSLLASPSVWQNRALIAAPMAGLGNGWRSSALLGVEDFVSCIISH